MFIGFLSFTNDAVFEQQKENQADISMLDETVLNALDIERETGGLISFTRENQ